MGRLIQFVVIFTHIVLTIKLFVNKENRTTLTIYKAHDFRLSVSQLASVTRPKSGPLR